MKNTKTRTLKIDVFKLFWKKIFIDINYKVLHVKKGIFIKLK